MTRGLQGEPKEANITITAADIGTGTAPNKSSREWIRGLGNANDDTEHILAAQVVKVMCSFNFQPLIEDSTGSLKNALESK